MKIWTLMENTACSPVFQAEHGLSLYIETGDTRILFDAGQSPKFAENAQKLEIDLQKTNFAVLSHGHYDHGGGLSAFLEWCPNAPVYVSRYAFGEHYNANNKYIGLDKALQVNPGILPVEENKQIAEGITLLSNSETPEETSGLQRKEDGILLPEDFRHEQYLLIEEKGKRVLFSGCSHKGIRSIVKWIPCDVLIGGFHFMKHDPAGAEIRQAAEELNQYNIQYYTGHCTGLAQFAAMKEILGDKLHYLSAGSVLEI